MKIPNSLKKIIKKIPLYRYLIWLYYTKIEIPSFYKHELIKNYAARFNLSVLIETGTFVGYIIDRVRNNFEEIYSIEIDRYLFKKTRNKFKKYPNIHIIRGDSAEMLPGVLAKIKQPCLFWVDAHCHTAFSGKNISRIDANIPITKELKRILEWWVDGSVILIDDAKYFIGELGWPHIKNIKQFVKEKLSDKYIFEVEKDIIRIYPSKDFTKNLNIK